LQDVALLRIAMDKMGGNTVLGGWTIPHPLSLCFVDNTNSDAHQIVLDEPWEVVM
jgi:hypothetical protein